MKLKYLSPLKKRFIENGEIVTDKNEIAATMISTDDFLGTDFCTFRHGSDGGGLQTELDEIGEKIVRAFNAHDDLLTACEQANKFLTHLLQTRAIREDASAFSWNMLNSLLTELPDAINKARLESTTAS